MGTFRPPFSPTKDDGVRVSLRVDERAALLGLVREYRQLLVNESQSSDPAVARLFPPAYREDPLRNFDYERQAHDGLMAQRLAAIDTVEQRTDTQALSAEEARTWLAVLNDLRLVLGTRLDITEQTTEATFAEDRAAGQAFGLYGWLTHLVGVLLEALDPGLADFQGPPPEEP